MWIVFMWWLDIFLAGITRLIDIRWGENTQTCSNMVCKCELGIDVWNMHALPVHFECIIGEKSGLYGNQSRNTIYIYLSNDKFITMCPHTILLQHALSLMTTRWVFTLAMNNSSYSKPLWSAINLKRATII